MNLRTHRGADLQSAGFSRSPILPFGAARGSRTLNPFRALDFESSLYTSSKHRGVLFSIPQEMRLSRGKMVPDEGVEPSRPFGHELLRLAWLRLHQSGMAVLRGIEPRFPARQAGALPLSYRTVVLFLFNPSLLSRNHRTLQDVSILDHVSTIKCPVSRNCSYHKKYE